MGNCNVVKSAVKSRGMSGNFTVPEEWSVNQGKLIQSVQAFLSISVGPCIDLLDDLNRPEHYRWYLSRLRSYFGLVKW